VKDSIKRIKREEKGWEKMYENHISRQRIMPDMMASLVNSTKHLKKIDTNPSQTFLKGRGGGN
jgi:hypothetical protein